MRHLALIAWALLGLTTCAVVSAQEDGSDLFTAPPKVPAATEPLFQLSLSLSQAFDYRFPVYGDAFDYSGEIKSPELSNEVGMESIGSDLKLASRWDFDLAPNAGAPNTQGQLGDWDSLARIRPLENYVSWNPGEFKLAFGYQIFSWGVADKRNPTDNINPQDFSLGMNADKIPILSSDIVWYPSNALSFEGVYVPFEQPDKWPVDPRSQLLAAVPAALLPFPDNVSYIPLDLKPGNLLAGFKANYHSATADFALSYLYDFDPFYTPRITVIQPGGPGTPCAIGAVSLERRRIHRFGADAKTAIGKVGLWIEAAYSLTDNSGSGDYSARKSKLDYTAGFDFSYGPNDSYYLNIQEIGTYIPGFDDKFGSDYPGGQPTGAGFVDPSYMQKFFERSLVNSLGSETEGLLQGITVDSKWELLDALLTPELIAAYTFPFFYDASSETRYGSLVLNPEIDLMPLDSFHVKLGAALYYSWHEVPGGRVELDAGNAIGAFTSSNCVYLEILYKWRFDLGK